MLCCVPDTPEARHDRAIAKMMKQDFRSYNSVVKLLLLGTGGSGKSTIFKQMRIIHSKGYTKEDLLRYKDIIYENCYTNTRALIHGMELLKISFELPENQSFAAKVKSIPAEEVTVKPSSFLTPQTGQQLKAFWADKGVQEAYEKRSAFQLNDSTEYYFTNMDRIAALDYVPTEQDVLRSRVRTVGIVEAEFKCGPLNFKMVDVGGQRNERRKWIHVFDSVTAIIFVTSLSEYDMKLEEDETMNRMRESILLFDEICNCRYFKNTSMIVFFNKKDLFAEKIKKVDLSVCFPDYKGGNNYKAAVDFIKKKFTEVNKHTKGRQLYTHETCATDTTNIRKVFDCVKNIFLHDNIRNVGMGDI